MASFLNRHGFERHGFFFDLGFEDDSGTFGYVLIVVVIFVFVTVTDSFSFDFWDGKKSF